MRSLHQSKPLQAMWSLLHSSRRTLRRSSSLHVRQTPHRTATVYINVCPPAAQGALHAAGLPCTCIKLYIAARQFKLVSALSTQLVFASLQLKAHFTPLDYHAFKSNELWMPVAGKPAVPA